MSIRKEVAEFVLLGRLPPEDADEAVFQRHEVALAAIAKPVTPEEAKLLMKCFPASEESAYGLAWNLLHLIETATPIPLPQQRPSSTTDYWLADLWDRSHR